MALLDLANELLVSVARYLDRDCDINSFAQVNRRLYHLVNVDLYRHNARRNGSSALAWAATTGLCETLTRAIFAGARVHDHVLLPLAAHNGHPGVVRLLLGEDGADIKAKDDAGWTPLGAASRRGIVETVEMLVDAGADLKAGYLGWTPLNIAADAGNVDVVKYLVDCGAEIEDRSESGWTPLKSAACNGHAETVRLLLSVGANVHAAADRGWTALHSAANAGHGDVVQILVENGADPAAATVDGWTPLTLAADKGQTDSVKALLANGADMTLACGNGWTPLTLASDSGHADVVQLLLDHGADIMSTCNYGWTPLSLAAGAGRASVVKLLLDNGAKISATNDAGWSALLTATDRGHRDVVEILLEHGADATAANRGAWTPLHAAAENGDFHVTKLLVKAGADPMVGNRSGWTPFHVAAHHNRADMVAFYMTLPNTEPYQKDNNGRTAAFHAAMRGNLKVLDVMLRSDPNIATVEDLYGTPAVLAAARNGHEDVVRRLLPAVGYQMGSVDYFGHGITYWAARSGCAGLLSLVQAYSRKVGYEPAEIEKFDGDPVMFVEDSCWCEACARCTIPGTTSWECPKCDGGCFLICAECYDCGIRCRETSHGLMPHVCTRRR